MPLPKEVTFVTFDVYGTLIDWETGIYEAFSKEAEKDGYTIARDELIALFMETQKEIKGGSYELYAEVLRRTAVQISKQLGWPLEPSRSGFLPDSVQRWPPFKETNTQLERFKKKFEIGLIANVDDKLLGETRRHFKPDFDLVVTAQQVRSYKPDPAHFKECERRIGGKKGWVHVASDYYYDVEPCIKAKVPVIWVNRNKEQLDSSAEEADRRGEDAPRGGQAARRRLSRGARRRAPPRRRRRHVALLADDVHAGALRRGGVLHRLAGAARTSSRSCRRSPSRRASASSGCSPRTPTGTTCSAATRSPTRRWASASRPRSGCSAEPGARPARAARRSTRSTTSSGPAPLGAAGAAGAAGARAAAGSATQELELHPADGPHRRRHGDLDPVGAACWCAATTSRRSRSR